MNRNLKIGFSSLEQEVSNISLQVEGYFPKWLTGNLIRNGAAKFELGSQQYNHWFDGLAMLHNFSFNHDKIFYTNKFLQGNTYKNNINKGKIIYSEFATVPNSSLPKRIFKSIIGDLTDNASVNVSKIGEHYIALTETPARVEFKLDTLETVGRFKYNDNIKGHLTTVHPHFDYENNKLFNYITRFSLHSTYNIYSMDPGSKKRKKLSTIPVKQPSYMHTFGITDNFIILSQFPLFIDPLRLLKTGGPLADNLFWKPEHGTTFLIISKNSGKIVSTLKSDPFFAFHHVNCFEKKGKIVVDIVAYSSPNVINSVYLNKLLAGDFSMPTPQLRRYILNYQNSRVEYGIISSDFPEFPRINYKNCSGNNYNFIYGLMDHNSKGFLNKLVKIDINGKHNLYWCKENHFPGEPVFVPHPNSKGEDEGIIFSLVLDLNKMKTYLLILDGISFKELGRAYLPFAIPFGSHGQYFD